MYRLILLFLLPLVGEFNDNTERWLVTEDSRIVINGKTNVNTFSCLLGKYTGGEKLILEEDPQGLTFNKGLITLEVNRFDCGHQIMNQDFVKTLHGIDYPQVMLNLTRVELLSEIAGTGIFEITIAGEKVPGIDIKLDIFRRLEKFHLHGTRQLKMSDFGIAPPTKLFGLLQVEDSITIEFDLVMDRI